MSAVQGFVAKYVRELAMDDARRDAMLMSLREGKPFLQEENMTVAIIDVAGYSALASLLEQMLGKLSSEVITSAVGDYMAKIAEVIYRYDGDIVKFLGDALLVTFSSTSPSDTNDSTSLRAIECCLEILKRYPVYEINLDQWSQILKASQTPVDPAIDTHTLSSEHRKMSVDGSVKVSQKLDKRRSLTLHVAVARGSVGRVILGAPGRRLDYLVYGECLTKLGAMLDASKSGEMGISSDLLSLLEVNDISSRAVHDGFEVLGRKEVSRLADGISPGTATRQDSILSRIETAEHAYVVGRSNSVSGSIRRASVFPVHSIPEAAVEFIKHFVNRSVLYRLNEVMPNKSWMKEEDKNMEGGTEKPIDLGMNRKRHSIVEKSKGQAGLVRSEYRTVSVIFVKIHGDFEADRAQTFLVKFLGQLDLFNGVFQQYSVDDKGQSMLACFGLPPFVSDKCGLIAVKAAARFAYSLPLEDLCKVSISVTTGDILFGTVGWEYRKDAALLGDAVNVAARLLSIDKGVILLDDRTRELVGDTFSVTNLGFMKVKGKAHPLNVWSISNFTAVAVQTDLSVSWTQNKTERQILSQDAKLWKEGRKSKVVFLVEGDSGMGKSTLLVFVQKVFKELSILSCIARGSEVDQLNSFIAVRDIFIQMLQIRGLHTTTRSSSLTISTIATGRTSFVETNVMTLDKSAYESLLRDAKENVGFATLLLAMVKGESFAQQGDEEVTMDRRSMITKRNEGDGSDEAKRRALKFVLVRVISHLCAKYRIAVLLDDAQWIDDSSLEVFFILADKHPELFMTTFTRPIRNLETGNFLHQLLASNFVHHLPLAGISLEDMSSILAQYMKAKSVEVKLLNEIYGQTHGNLLQTESLLRYLMERSDEVVYVDESGQLCGKNSETLKTVISQSVEAVIMSQFDRLHTDFQHVLRCASILGQYIDLHGLSLLLQDENLSPEDIRSLIAIHDQFEFLSPCEGTFSDSGAGVYYFRHISIMNAIYQSVAFVEREELHSAIAEHLDEVVLLNPGKREQTLPTICYHYWRTRNGAKILQRVSELGLRCFQNFLWQEARKSLQNVDDYLNDNIANLQVSLKDSDRHLLEPIFHCRALAYLAMTKANLKDLSGGLDSALKCFNIAGLIWPTNPKAVKKMIVRYLWRSIRNWRASNKGRNNIRVSTKSPRELQPDWFPIISTNLDALLLLSSYAVLDKSHTTLVVMWSLSQAYITCETNPSYLFKMLFWASWLIGQQGSPLALIASRRMALGCQLLQPRCDSSIKTVFHLHQALLFTHFGTTRESLEGVREYEEYWLERRVKVQQYKAYNFYGLFSIFNGDMSLLKPRLTDEWITEMKGLDIYWYCAITGVYQIDCFFKNDRVSLEKFNKLQKEVCHIVSPIAIIRMGSSVKVNDLLVLMLRESAGNVLLEASAEALLEIIGVSVVVNHKTTVAAVVSVCIAIVGVCTSTVPMKMEVVTRLLVIIPKFLKGLKAITKYCWMGKLATLILLTMKFHLSGTPNMAVKLTRRLLILPEFKDKIHMGGDLSFIGAFCCAIIALSSLDESEARLNRIRAIDMFEEMGFAFMVTWVAKEMKLAA